MEKAGEIAAQMEAAVGQAMVRVRGAVAGREREVLAGAAGAVVVLGAVRVLRRRNRRTPLARDWKGAEAEDPAKRRVLPRRLPARTDAIVIGSGIGGMAAASVLAQNGLQVLVLENHDKLGGCTHTFEISHKNPDGKTSSTCEFDTGTHYTAVDMCMPTARSGAIMRYVTGGLDWVDLGDPYDRVVFPEDNQVPKGCPNNDSYDFVKNEATLIEEISQAINPLDPEVPIRLKSFIDFCWKARKSVNNLYLSHLLPRWLEWIIPTRKFYDYGRLTTAYVMDAILVHGMSHEDVYNQKPLPEGPPKDSDAYKTYRRLKGVMIHPIGDYACQPRESSIVAHALTACYYLDGAAYTKGPTQNISRRAAQKVIENGGDCLVNAYVESIIIENGRAVGVRVCKSSSTEREVMAEVRADYIVNATGMYNLYNRLLPQDLPIVKQWKETNRAVPSTGHNFMFVCIKGTPEEAGIPTTNTWYLHSYSTDEAFDNYFADPANVRPPTVYLGFPCTKDVEWKQRYPDVSNCILISDAQYSWYKEWEDSKTRHRGQSYEEFKAHLSKHLLEILYEKVPQVKGKVLWYELGTPLSDANYLQSYEGGSYGTRCNVDYFSEPSKRWLMRGDTEIKGLYMAGQDAWTPAVAGAMYGGFLGACKVLGTAKSAGLLWSILGQMADNIQSSAKISRPKALFTAVATCLNWIKPIPPVQEA